MFQLCYTLEKNLDRMQIPLSNKISNREKETMMIIFNMINLFALISYVLLQ